MTDGNAAQSSGNQATGSNPTVVEKPLSANTGDWTQGLSEELRGYVQHKGFKDPGTVVDQYRNLEKMRGVPAERLVTLPERSDDEAAWKQVYDRLGRPQKPEEYSIPMPEKGGDEEFAKFARTIFHEAGLNVKQGEKIAGKWNEYVTGIIKQQEEAHQAKVNEQDQALKAKWGNAFEANVEEAKKAAAAFGLTAEQVNQLEGALGLGATMELLHRMGTRMGEAELIRGDRKPKILTAEGAKQEIARLMTDQGFLKALDSGDIVTKERWENLHIAAYPGESELKSRRG